jgi:hypothetical protein
VNPCALHEGTSRPLRLLLFMDTRIVKAAADRVLAAHTDMGLRGDPEHRQQLREAVTAYIERLVQHGELGVDELVARALKHLRSLEERKPSHRAG